MSKIEGIVNLIRDNVVLFRGIRFPARQNLFSLHNETNLDTEIRKIKRRIGEKTLTKEFGTKNGNTFRSTTLLKDGNELFSYIGYCIINPDVNHIKKIDANMDDRPTGYGKKEYMKNYTTNYSNDSFDYYINEIKKTDNKFIINEITIDLTDKDINFLFYTNSKYRVITSEGRESIFEDVIDLDAVYTKNKMGKELKRDIPMIKYNVYKKEYTEFNPSNAEILKMMLNVIRNKYDTVKDRFDALIEFSDIAKKNSRIFDYIGKRLCFLKGSVLSEERRLKMQGFESETGVFVNHANNYIKSLIQYSKVLKRYEQRRQSEQIANRAMAILIKSYSNPRSAIYSVKSKCSHQDIHLRTFVNNIDTIKELMSEKNFNRYLKSIKNTFIKIYSRHNKKSSLMKDFVKKYSREKSYLKDIELKIKEYEKPFLLKLFERRDGRRIL